MTQECLDRAIAVRFEELAGVAPNSGSKFTEQSNLRVYFGWYFHVVNEFNSTCTRGDHVRGNSSKILRHLATVICVSERQRNAADVTSPKMRQRPEM